MSQGLVDRAGNAESRRFRAPGLRVGPATEFESSPSSIVEEVLSAGLPASLAAELVGLDARAGVTAGVGDSPGLELTEGKTTESVVSAEPIAPAPPLWRAIGPIVTVDDTGEPPRPDWLRNGSQLERLGSSGDPPLAPRPLIPAGRLGCVLRQRLTRLEPGTHLDEPRLVYDLAHARFLRELPRALKMTWPRRVQLYWDRARATSFCWSEQHRVDRWLTRWLGKLVVERCYTDGLGPTVRHHRGKRLAPLPLDLHTAILALSDLGAADGHRERQRFWVRLAAKAARAGTPAVALVLCPRARWPKGFARGWELVEWEHARPLRRVVPGSAPLAVARTNDRGLAERLLTLLVPTVRIEPGLLREARDLLRHETATFSTELDVWLDARMATRSSEGAALFPEARIALRSKYLALPESLRRDFERLLERHHARLSPVILAEELLACARDPATLTPGEIDPPLERARAILAEYARRLEAAGVGSDSEVLYVTRLTERQPAEAWAEDRLAAVWAFSNLSEERMAFTAPLPEGLDLARIAYALRQVGQLRWARLWQLGHELVVEPIAVASAPLAERKGSYLADLPLRHGQLLVRGLCSVEPDGRAVGSALLHIGERSRLALPAQPSPRAVVRLESDVAVLQLTAEERPRWAKSIRRDRRGLWVTTDIVEFDWIDAHSKQPVPPRVLGVEYVERAVRQRDVLWPSWAVELDRDEYGVVASLELAPGMLMRLRWIPPGRFLMGSPRSELGRYDDAGPQHWVRLSSGLWLAETLCTQAQWETVMGNNPSGFPGDLRRPVEQVSWNDCIEFCTKLNVRFPGVGARLPTEAEWEYACRAGTTNAYNGGSEPTQPAAHDPALDRLGWFGKNSGGITHPVGEKKPNAWGIHDMHGNVWEWCSDWFGAYAAEEQRDPSGAAEGLGRVFRGGCWYDLAGSCRSASRRRFEPGYRGGNLGFRLAAVQ